MENNPPETPAEEVEQVAGPLKGPTVKKLARRKAQSAKGQIEEVELFESDDSEKSDSSEIEELYANEETSTKGVSDSASNDSIPFGEDDMKIIENQNRPISPIRNLPPILNTNLIHSEIIMGSNNINDLQSTVHAVNVKELSNAEYLEEISISLDKVEYKSLHSDKVEYKSLHSDKVENKSLHSDKIDNKSLHSDKVENKSLHSDKVDDDSSISETNLSYPSDIKTVRTVCSDNRSAILSTHNQSDHKSLLSHQLECKSSTFSYKSDNKTVHSNEKSQAMPQVNQNDLDEYDERRAGDDQIIPSGPPPTTYELDMQTSSQTEQHTIQSGTSTIRSKTSSFVKKFKKSKDGKEGSKKSLNTIMRKLFKKKKQIVNTDE